VPGKRLAFLFVGSYGRGVAVATGQELRPGDEIAGYRVESVAGRGGMGVVYRAVDLRLKRPVALKLLAPKLAADPRFRDRFLRESELAASLDHSHVVPVYSAGEADGHLYIAMRFVDGTDLGALLEREGSLDAPRAVRLVAQIAAALDAGHARGLVHRDVKPGNVLIAQEQDSEHCYLSDFGLSRGSDEDGQAHGSHLSGTVAYTAPEQVTGGPVDGRADLYSLGCVLYECVTGHPPFEATRRTAVLFAHVHDDVPVLPAFPALDPVLQRALAKQPGDRYPSCRDFVEAARAALVGEAAERAAASRSELRAAEADLAENVAGLQRTPPGPVDRDATPFKGLATFDTGDADFFFGRERLVAELVARVAGASLLCVVGASGSGKSSVLRAGLLTALAAGVLPGSETWAQSVIRPGERPLEELERALEHAPGERLVLVVDQLEEVFTHCREDADRRVFFDRLLAEARTGSLVVLAIRADFYGQLADYPELAAQLGENQVLVGQMQPGELRRAIELPAQRAGVVVESALTDALIADVVDEPGGLPLLSTTLLELWQRRDGDTLTATAYAETGGVRGSVARLAERAVEGLGADEQATARSILLRLAGGEGDLLVRRRVPLDELDLQADERVRGVLDVLTSSRLVTVSEGTAEVAHEALLREWPRLRGWLDEDAEGRRLHQHLIRAAKDWDDRGRDAAELYRGARLASVLDWTGAHDSDLNELERTYVEESRAAAETETRRVRRTNRRLRALLAGAGLLLAVALAAGALALISRSDAKGSATAAVAQRLGAQALLVKDLDLSLLLARQGVALDDSVATRGNLQAALVRSPAALRVFRPLPGRPLSIDISPDGKFLSVDSNSGKTAIVDAASLRLRRTVGSRGAIFGRDGRLITVGGTGADVSLEAVVPATGKSEVLGSYRTAGAGHNAFSRDGRTVAAQDEEGNVVVTDLRTGRVLHRIELRAGLDVRDIELGLLGDRLVVFEGRGADAPGTPVTVEVWELSPWHRVAVFGDQAGAHSFALTPDGRLLALGHVDGSITLHDLSTGRARSLQGRHTSIVQGVAFSPDGATLASGGDDERVRVWDAVSGAQVDSFEGHGGRVFAPVFSPDGRTLYTVSLDGSGIAWDLRGDRRIGRPFRAGSTDADQEALPSVTFDVSPDGRLVATGQLDGATSIVDLAKLRQVALTPRAPGRRVFGVAWSPTGRSFATAASFGYVDTWTRDGTHIRSFRGPDSNAYAITYSPDGRLLAASSEEGRVYLWDTRTGRLVSRAFRTESIPLHVTFSPDGKLIAAASCCERLAGGVGYVWRVADAKRLYMVDIDDGYGLGDAIAFSRDGELLATGGGTGIIKFWDAATGKRSGRSVLASAGWVLSVEFGPTGQLLLTAGTDGTARLFDVRTRAPYGVPFPGLGSDLTAAFTPDGRRAVSVYSSGQAFLWDLDAGSLARAACTIAGRTLTRDEWDRYLPGRAYKPACSA
jgi:WD40 repeat protein